MARRRPVSDFRAAPAAPVRPRLGPRRLLLRPGEEDLSKTLPDVRDKVTCGSSWGVAGAHGRGGVRDAAKSIRQCSCPPR